MTTHRTNRVKPAVSGDTGDVRTWLLAGVDDLPDAGTYTGSIWRTGVTPAAFPVTWHSARKVTVNLGAWLSTNPAAGDWSGEIVANGVTWPASSPFTLEVRDDAP